MNFFAISALINALVALGFGIFVIAYNFKSKVSRLYFLMGIAIALWAFGYWQWQLSSNSQSALFWARILTIGSTLIPVFYFHWIATLLERDEKEKNIIILNYIVASVILLFSFSPLVVKSVTPKIFFPFWPNPGILYHVNFIYIYCILVAYSLVILLKNYKTSSGDKKAQIIYVIIGSAVGFGGGIFNFFLWYNIPIAPYGNFLLAFYPFFLGYAVIKYRLFDVRIAATQGFIFLIWVLLFAKILLSENIKDLLANLGIFFAVLIIGFFLIRGILKDIKQKEQIEKMNEEVTKAYELEKHANKELKQLDEAKTQFMLITQHHLRTPLSVNMGFLALLESGQFGKMSAKMKEVILKLKSSTQKEINVVNELLDVSSYQLGKEMIKLQSNVDIEALVEDTLKDLTVEAENKGLYLKFEKKGNVPTIPADPTKLMLALTNIIDDCVKYTKEGGVVVSLKKENDKLLIMVKDTGMGISKDLLPNLFNQTFYRGEQAQKEFAVGKGIGLFLSGKIIEGHKGRIWTESEGEGKGSVFYIELPVVV